MNITVVKEELLKLYEKSLFFSEDYIGHPIRVIQAVKSIIGINTDKPVDSLLEFCKVYTDKYKFIEKINRAIYIIALFILKLIDKFKFLLFFFISRCRVNLLF